MKSKCLGLALVVATMVVTSSSAAPGSIVEVAASAGQFYTLVVTAKAAGLVELLSGPGPFTVFAPTDDAFRKLPPGTVESLLKPENKAKLVAILTCHFVPGKVLADELKPGKLKTVQGGELTVEVVGGKVTVDNANVVKTNISASNGIIHEIDSVLLPRP